jgi:hypothetical protein
MQMTFDFPANLTEEVANSIFDSAPEYMQGIAFVAVANAKLGQEIVIPANNPQEAAMIGAVSIALAFTTECPAERLPQFVVLTTVDEIEAAQAEVSAAIKRAAN